MKCLHLFCVVGNPINVVIILYYFFYLLVIVVYLNNIRFR